MVRDDQLIAPTSSGTGHWPGPAANCTQSADLAGIYFAVVASCEQQIVNANQQALTSAVQQYRAAYAKELSKLPGLLKTTKATPFPTGKAVRTRS